MIIIYQKRAGTPAVLTNVDVVQTDNALIALGSPQWEIPFDTLNGNNYDFFLVIGPLDRLETYDDLVRLHWFVFNGKEAKDKFVVHGNVYSLEEIRALGIKEPRHSL